MKQTPSEQLVELAYRIDDHRVWVEHYLANRHFFSFDVSYERSPEAQSHSLYLAPNLVAHDAILMRGEIDRPIAEMDALKHMLIYGDRLVVPDYPALWAKGIVIEDGANYAIYEKQEGAAVADSLESLIPLADLIRSGDILLIPPPGYINLGNEQWSDAVMIAADPHDEIAYGRDPYLSFLAINEADPGFWRQIAGGLGRGESLDYSEIQDVADKCISEVAKRGSLGSFTHRVTASTWPNLDDRHIKDILEFSLIIRETGLLPVASDAAVLQHLDRCSRVLFSDGLSPRSTLNIPSYEPAVRYHISALSNVSLKDVIRVRQNEEIFYDLRHCLTTLAENASAVGRTGSYTAFNAKVSDLAEEIVRPTYERLEKARKKSRTQSMLWDWASGGILSLGMHALGTLVGLPGPAASTAKTVANLSRKQVTKRMTKNQGDLEIVGSILYSLID